MTYTQREEGTGPQVLRPRRLCSICSRSWERQRELGAGLGPKMVELSQEECSLLPSISDMGRTKRRKAACFSPGSLEGDKGTFVFEASFQMPWNRRSPWPSEALGAPKDRAWQAVAWQERQHLHELETKAAAETLLTLSLSPVSELRVHLSL